MTFESKGKKKTFSKDQIIFILLLSCLHEKAQK